MEKIIGGRRSGKTTKLIELAHSEGYVLVEPTYHMAENARLMARDKGYEIVVLTASQFLFNHFGSSVDKYLVDELDMFLENIGIKGYSNGPREKEQPKTKPMIHNSSEDVWYYVCNDCNYPLSPGDNYCGKCGKQIIWGESIDT